MASKGVLPISFDFQKTFSGLPLGFNTCSFGLQFISVGFNSVPYGFPWMSFGFQLISLDFAKIPMDIH